MPTILDRFKVQNFRSIEESDWIDVASNSCLVGTNEAGKTNLLLALWKLNPVNKEPIIPLNDFPRHLYSNYAADNHSQDVFISADFLLDAALQQHVATALSCDIEQIQRVLIQRKYDGSYIVSFPYSKIDSVEATRIKELMLNFESKLYTEEFFIKESVALQTAVKEHFHELYEGMPQDLFSKKHAVQIIESLQEMMDSKFGKKKNLPQYFKDNIILHIEKLLQSFEGTPISITEQITEELLKEIPQFIYYSDYGNLDSEIYLPRVIHDFERTDLPESARAKARTLKVLFKYVNLSPEQIYQLGNDTTQIIQKVDAYDRLVSTTKVELTDAQIKDWSDKKRERGILLRAAATQLTGRFRKWWLQGNYVFEFEADGPHFRINVSDDLRPEPIELEGRSKGLQWFFSFFLVFLVETKEGHSNAILLLDEPGLSLHPLAQFDLAKFFRNLAENNQLIYTSHSPFLVDMDNLANVKAVYVDKETGRTKVSTNLRYNTKDAEKSIYPIHAALGLTVSDTLLLGCLPILVEGPSDQIYLSLIKRYLIGIGDLQNSKEIVFIPTGGVKGVGPITKLISSRDDALPFVLLDSDSVGTKFQQALKDGRYKDEAQKVLGVAQFLSAGEFEIEDLIPARSIIEAIDKKHRADTDFSEIYKEGLPIVDQIQDWALKNSILLEEGWKVELARTIQNKFEKSLGSVSEPLKEAWKKLFYTITGASA